jgi:PAS domain S-box-containing protein
MPVREAEERVLVIAPTGNDAVAMADFINSQGFRAQICSGPAEGARFALEGAGALLLTEEALKLPGVTELLDTLKAQPPWSELPLIILTSGGESRLANLLDTVASAAGSITLLERPMSSTTLSRSIHAALRSRRRQYEARELIELNSNLAAIVQYSEDAIISKDLNGIITSWNPGAEHLFGYTAQEAIGRPITIIVPADRMDEEPNILDHVGHGERFKHYQTVRRRKNEKTVEVSLTISPLQNERGEIVGASQIARDITAQKRAAEALRQAQRELQRHAGNLEKAVAERTADLRATNEQLETFIYSIAHDLRAPLRSMTGYAELLLEDYGATLEPAGQKMLKRIQEASEFMDKLLMDLLTYGRTASAPMDLGLVEVKKAWDNALFQCAVQIEECHASVETVPPLPRVRASESTLGQILANLLSNGLKFVAPGVRPQIRFWAEPQGILVRLWMQDNGIGIPLDQQSRVFRVFERLHGARYAGTGIGLSIVRKGVERMGGRVGVQSEPGKGSRFWIELPAAANGN